MAVVVNWLFHIEFIIVKSKMNQQILSLYNLQKKTSRTQLINIFLAKFGEFTQTVQISQVMFEFLNCCSKKQNLEQEENEFQVILKAQDSSQQISYVRKIDDIPLDSRRQRFNRIIQKRKSEYFNLVDTHQKKQSNMIDQNFPPNSTSVGDIKDLNVKFAEWKRIHEVVKDPVLFDNDITPTDVIQGILGDCYFLSAIAALAENPETIKSLFSGRQRYNFEGIYKVTMRVDGIIQDVIVDDYIPVNQQGKALFCQPNKNQFWVLIVEKAWAKVQGSYANIISGSPAEVFKALTYAPTQSIYPKDLGNGFQEKLWNKIIQYAALDKDYPCVAGTNDEVDVKWRQIGLIPGHAYTLLDVANLQSFEGRSYRMMKLRNPWGHCEWQGEGNQSDKKFWQKIEPSSQKTKFLRHRSVGNDGIFYMRFKDFCKYFQQIHFCLLENRSNYKSQKMRVNGKNGELFSVCIYDRGLFTFQLHQQDLRGQRQRRKRQGLSRGSLLLMKDSYSEKKFIDGKMRYNDEDISLSVQLQEGNYLLFAKLDPTRSLHILPQKASVSIYSVSYASLKPCSQYQKPRFMHEAFLGYARNNKKNQYLDGKMWVSFDILLHKGGYGYIAFGNEKSSNKKFVCQFNELDFNDMGYKLKKPLKGGRHLHLQVNPGQEQIVLVRIQNRQITSVSFPPPVRISIENSY